MSPVHEPAGAGPQLGAVNHSHSPELQHSKFTVPLNFGPSAYMGKAQKFIKSAAAVKFVISASTNTPQLSLNIPCHKSLELPGQGGMESLGQHKPEVFSGNIKSTLQYSCRTWGVFLALKKCPVGISGWEF